MKRQAISDIWRHIGPGWGNKPRINSIAPVTLPGFLNTEALLHGGLSVVCGANSSGKTRLLASLMTAVRDSETSLINVKTTGINPASVAFLDTSWQLQRQVISLSGDATLPDRKVQAGFFEVRKPDLRLISYVLGSDISSIKMFELDSTDDTPLLAEVVQDHLTAELSSQFRTDVIPYFEVTSGDSTRGSLQLSQGELTVLTLYWALKSADEGSLLVMDEPDAFLSPQSGRRVFDLIAHLAYEQECPCVITSHSYLALSSLPQNHLLVLRTDIHRQTSLETGSKDALWKALQVGPTRRIVFAVEDEAGKQWLNALFRLVEFEHTDVSAVWNVKGEVNVGKVAEFPQGGESDIAFWGILDGDQRGKNNKGQFIILPGSKSPESVILDILKTGEDPIMGRGITRNKIEDILAAHAGEDPHEQVIALAKGMGFELPSFRERIWTDWLVETEDGKSELARFAEALSAVTLPST